MAARKNWIAVASAEHARFGRDAIKEFMQVGHGKLAPLKRIKPDDRVAYYAPTAVYGARDELQSFVSIGPQHHPQVPGHGRGRFALPEASQRQQAG